MWIRDRYQVGSFPAYGRWAEWNGKYRDDIRRFLKGDEGMVPVLAERIQGSPDLYGWNQRGPTASINFITCHDGFTLYDLFAYNDKHNEANGEQNRDGGNDNHSWNCGVEGETDDAEVNALRQRMIKNALAILLMSHGVQMCIRDRLRPCQDSARPLRQSDRRTNCLGQAARLERPVPPPWPTDFR